jgi:hypothetical protein
MSAPDWLEEIAETLNGGTNGMWTGLNIQQGRTIIWMKRSLRKLIQEVREQAQVIADLREDRGDIYIVQPWGDYGIVGVFHDRVSADKVARECSCRLTHLVKVVRYEAGDVLSAVVSLWRRGKSQCMACRGYGTVIDDEGRREMCPKCLGECEVV